MTGVCGAPQVVGKVCKAQGPFVSSRTRWVTGQSPSSTDGACLRTPDRWRVVQSALSIWSWTTRLCLILLIPRPLGTVVIWMIREVASVWRHPRGDVLSPPPERPPEATTAPEKGLRASVLVVRQSGVTVTWLRRRPAAQPAVPSLYELASRTDLFDLCNLNATCCRVA